MRDDDRSNETCYVVIDEADHLKRRLARRRFALDELEVVDPWSYHAKVGRGTIRLSLVEYRILKFLAARPNQALTRIRIAEAVSTASHCVTVESLGRYIHSLRGQLGFF